MTLELTQMLNFIKSLFDNRSDEERYLSRAHDIYDLENRQRMLNRGDAPFQKYNKLTLDVWNHN